MPTLFVQSCSATKQDTNNPMQALDLYDGYFFRIIKKAMRTGRLRAGFDILIISAKHGIVNPTDTIGYYDKRIDRDRARELNADIIESIVDKVNDNKYEKIYINLGQEYLPAIEGLESAVDIPVKYIKGSGIGIKGKRLKQLLSSDLPDPILDN